MGIRDYRDSDLDEFDYGRRPSGSAWLAVLAVAFGFFMAGGFIKTYRELEEARESHKKEVQELRQTIKALQHPSGVDNTHSSGAAPRGARPLPQASRVRQRLRPESEAARRTVSTRPPSGESGTSSLYRESEGEDEERPKVVIGRRSPEDAFASQRANMQVISVSTAQKRVMIEGGRDMGITAGERFGLYRSGKWIGDVRVVDVYDDKSACEVLPSTQTPEPGDRVR